MRIVPSLGVLLVAITAAGCARLAPAAEPTSSAAPTELGRAVLVGCGPVVLPQLPDGFHEFTPLADRMSGRPYLPLFTNVTVLSSPVSSLDDVVGFEARVPVTAPKELPLQAITLGSSGSAADAHVGLLYAPTPIGKAETLPEFLARGGVVVVQKPVGDAVGTASDVVDEVGERAVLVEVGPHPAALVHAEPIGAETTRPYGLHWSDGEVDWTLTGVATPEELISFARSLYCP